MRNIIHVDNRTYCDNNGNVLKNPLKIVRILLTHCHKIGFLVLDETNYNCETD